MCIHIGMQTHANGTYKHSLYTHHPPTQLVKDFHSKIEVIKENAAAKIVEARTLADSPSTPRAPGFLDFTSPSKGAAKKKRQLPIAPRRRPRAGTGDSEGR